MGRLTEQVDAREGHTLYQYEPDYAMPSVIRYADGEDQRFHYDQAGRLLAQEDGCGRTEYGYNARNKCTLVRDGEGNESRWSYDGMGRLQAHVLRRRGNRTKHVLPEAYDVQEDDGEGWSYTYDNENRMKTVTGPDGVLLFSAEYDLAGNLTAETDAAGRTGYRMYALDGSLQELLPPVEEEDGEILYRRTAYQAGLMEIQ